MKKFTRLFAAAVGLLMPLSTYAFTVETTNSTSVDDITEGYYVIRTKWKGNDGTLYSSGNSSSSNVLLASTSVTYSSVTDTKYVWYVTKTSNGFVIQNVGTGAYIPAQNGHGGNMGVSKTIENAAILEANKNNIDTLKLEDNAVTLYEKYYLTGGANYYIHGNTYSGTTGALSYWEGGAYKKDDSSVIQFVFYAVTDASDLTITPSYAVAATKDGTTTYSVEAFGADFETQSNSLINATVSSSDELSYWNRTYSVNEEDKFVSRTNATFTITALSTDDNEDIRPFEYYDATATTPALYTINFRNDASKYLIYTSGDNVPSNNQFTTSSITTYSKFKGALWGFVKSNNGVKLLCYQNKKYIKATTTNGEKSTFVDSEDDATTFIGLTNSYGSNSGFTLFVSGSTQSVIGDHAESNLGTWTYTLSTVQNDGGSSFKVTKVNSDIIAIGYNAIKTEKATEVAAVSSALSAPDTHLAVSVKPTDYPYTAMVYTLVNGGTYNAITIKALDGVYAEVSAAATKTFYSAEPSGYYKIVSAPIADASNRYASTITNVVGTDGNIKTAYDANNSLDLKVTRVPSTSAVLPTIWKFEKVAENSYNILNVNTNAYLTNGAGNEATLATEAANASAFTLENHITGYGTGYDFGTMFLIHSGDYYINAFGGDSESYLKHYNNNESAGTYPTGQYNYWQFEKVTSVPVAISSLGYASVCFPFAVKVADGVTAYYAEKAENGKLYLSEYTDGIIPANTGAIIQGDEKTDYTFTISSEAGTTHDTKLQGATAQREGFTASTTYGLGKNNDKPAFLVSTMTHVPANKAYINASDITTGTGSISAFDFTFGGVVDGIEAATIQTAADAEVYYNLQGQRVLYPTKGIYVTASGQKVLLK